MHGITHRMFVKPGGSSLSEENAVELELLEIVEGHDLTMRKRRLLDAGDCLVALPGGIGTFDELFMAIAEMGMPTGGNLPVLALNTDGYYDGSMQQLQRAFDDGLLRQHWTKYVTFVNTPEEAIAWCGRQTPRTRPATSMPNTVREDDVGYHKGMVFGALAATAVLLTVEVLLRRRA